MLDCLFLILMASQTKMQSWIDLQSTILNEIISLDGLGEAQQDTCGSCLSRCHTQKWLDHYLIRILA